jgi:hypothetical protein
VQLFGAGMIRHIPVIIDFAIVVQFFVIALISNIKHMTKFQLVPTLSPSLLERGI